MHNDKLIVSLMKEIGRLRERLAEVQGDCHLCTGCDLRLKHPHNPNRCAHYSLDKDCSNCLFYGTEAACTGCIDKANFILKEVDYEISN